VRKPVVPKRANALGGSETSSTAVETETSADWAVTRPTASSHTASVRVAGRSLTGDLLEGKWDRPIIPAPARECNHQANSSEILLDRNFAAPDRGRVAC
jgi:hypothetical protein